MRVFSSNETSEMCSVDQCPVVVPSPSSSLLGRGSQMETSGVVDSITALSGTLYSTFTGCRVARFTLPASVLG